MAFGETLSAYGDPVAREQVMKYPDLDDFYLTSDLLGCLSLTQPKFQRVVKAIHKGQSPKP